MPRRVAATIALFCSAVLLAQLACSQFGSQPTVEAPIEPSPTSAIEAVAFDPPAAGERMLWTDSSTVVYVPGGSFVMGQDEKEPSDHSPVHTVTLGPFWIYQAEVTNRMYRTCVELGICTEPTQSLWYADPEYDNAPVSGVDWNQAKAYCEWMHGRLPTEAEWELAARGTDARPYPWGKDELTCDLLNFLDCLVPSVPDAVRSYPLGASPYKVADMAGNVSEWVADWYAEDYYAASPANSPLGPLTGEERVVRGSCYLSPLEETEIFLRSSQNPLQSQPSLGFRCVLDSDGQVGAPLCQVLSFQPSWDPLAGETEPAEVETIEVSAICGLHNDGTPWYSAAVNSNFKMRDLPAESLTFSSPQGEIVCDADVQFQAVCGGPAVRRPGQPLTVTVCVKPEGPATLAPTCPQSYGYNPSLGLCEYEPISDGGPCNAGTMVEGYGCLYPPQDGVCPVGFFSASYTGEEVCVPSGGPDSADPEHPLATCPPGLVFDDSNLCCEYPANVLPTCPMGSTLDEQSGQCIPEVTEWCLTASTIIPDCEPEEGPDKPNCSSFGNKDACEAAGCEWVFSAAGLSFCR